MNDVLVVGATGFVGAHTANLFAEHGWRVTGADIRLARPDTVLDGCIAERMKVVDIRAIDQLEELFTAQRFDAVVHCAGIVGPGPANRDLSRTIAVNVEGALNVAQVASTTGARVTYLSTATLYGPRSDVALLTEDLEPDPVGMYDASKYMGEIAIRTFARSSGLRWCALRPSFVYGPGSAVGEYFVPQALAAEPVTKPYGREQRCEFTYVKDLARAIYLSQTVDLDSGSVLNISSGEYRTLGDLATVVRSAVPGADITIGPGKDPTRHDRRPMSLARAAEQLTYAPRYTLEDGIVDWVRTARA